MPQGSCLPLNLWKGSEQERVSRTSRIKIWSSVVLSSSLLIQVCLHFIKELLVKGKRKCDEMREINSSCSPPLSGPQSENSVQGDSSLLTKIEKLCKKWSSLGFRGPKAESAISICYLHRILESAENYFILDIDFNTTGPRNIWAMVQ